MAKRQGTQAAKKEGNTSTALVTIPKRKPPVNIKALIPEIVDRLEQGESLHQICKDTHMPENGSLHRWISENPHDAGTITRARMAGYAGIADRLAAEIEDLKRDPNVTHEQIAVSKLRLDFEKWRLSKMLPKLFGEHKTVDHDVHVTISPAVRKL